MSRISKSTRESMARELVRHKFEDRAQELCAESVALFNAVIDERYPANVQKAMCQLEKLVPGGLDQAEYLYLRARGMRVSVGTTIGTYSIARWEPVTSPRLVLRDKDCEPSDALAERIQAFALSTQAFDAELSSAHRRALAALEQFSTAKKLAEEWPEAMPVIGHLIPEENRALPVVQMNVINDEFGLPPAEREAA